MRTVLAAVGVAVLGLAGLVAVVLAAERPAYVVKTQAAAVTSSSAPEILTSGDAIVSKKPDLAVVGAGIQSDGPTAAAAQADLAAKAAKLIARIKALGVADGDLSTTGYWIGPVYSPQGQSITGFRASEQLQLKWHNVDSVGRALDGIVQEGGANDISVSFGLNDPKPAEAEARSLAIGDARAKASAMAAAAGVHVGQVLQISDVATSSRPPMLNYAAPAAASVPTQVPVGEVDVQVSVEVDFAIA